LNIFGFIRRRYKATRLGDTLGDWTEDRWAPAAADGDDHFFLALQPIVNRQRKIFGYEALSRSGWDNRFSGNSEAATRTMIDNLVHRGVDELTNGSRTFLNCTRESLVGGSLAGLPRSTVLELLETITPDVQVLKACRRLKDLGYQIALDDFQFSENMVGLIELADYVKVDFHISGDEQRRRLFRRLRNQAITFIAEKVETQEQFETAIDEGFQLFQGYYLGRPTVFSRRKIPSNDMNHFLQLAAMG
jgi:c-di-GMP-related signal transduction protein